MNLYKFEEEVKTIVDKSVKEQGMEKTLAELQETWSSMEFEWEEHPRTGIKVLRVSEELIETLEADQVSTLHKISVDLFRFLLEVVGNDSCCRLLTAVLRILF